MKKFRWLFGEGGRERERERERGVWGEGKSVDENERWGSQNFVGLDYFYMIIHQKWRTITIWQKI